MLKWSFFYQLDGTCVTCWKYSKVVSDLSDTFTWYASKILSVAQCKYYLRSMLNSQQSCFNKEMKGWFVDWCFCIEIILTNICCRTINDPKIIEQKKSGIRLAIYKEVACMRLSQVLIVFPSLFLILIESTAILSFFLLLLFFFFFLLYPIFFIFFFDISTLVFNKFQSIKKTLNVSTKKIARSKKYTAF